MKKSEKSGKRKSSRRKSLTTSGPTSTSGSSSSSGSDSSSDSASDTEELQRGKVKGQGHKRDGKKRSKDLNAAEEKRLKIEILGICFYDFLHEFGR